MDVTPLVKEGAKIIQGYSDGSFRISGDVFDGAVIVFEDKVIRWDAAEKVDDLKQDDAKALIACSEDADVFLLGTGKSLTFPPAEFRKFLKESGVHVEVMDTGAACRTYNVLMAEGRRVAAALLLHS